MAGKVCDVCGGEATAVAGSALGGFSFAYCPECASSGAEPINALAATVAMCGGEEHMADWIKPVIAATLERTGASREEFDGLALQMEDLSEMGGE